MPNQNQTMTITLGDTLQPANVLFERNGNPISLSGSTLKVKMVNDVGTEVIAETATGVTAEPTQVFTASATTHLLSCNDHGVKDLQQIIVASTTTLPSGLAASTRYFAREVTPNSFRVSLTPNGALIDLASAGTGTHTFYIVGTAQYDWQSADVDTAGTYWLWFIRIVSSEKEHIPHDGRKLRVDIVAAA